MKKHNKVTTSVSLALLIGLGGACGKEERVPFVQPNLDDVATLEEAFSPLVCGNFDLQITGVRYANNIQTREASSEVRTGGERVETYRREARRDSRFLVIDARVRNTASKPRRFSMGEIVIDDKFEYENAEFVEGYDCSQQAIEPLLSEEFTVCWEIPKVNSDQIEWRVGDGWCSVDLDEAYSVSQRIFGKTAEQVTREREEAESAAKKKEAKEFKEQILEERVKLEVARDSIEKGVSKFKNIGPVHERATTSLDVLDELQPIAEKLDLESTLQDALKIGDEITELLVRKFTLIADSARREEPWTISERLDVISHGSGQPAVQGDSNVARLVRDALASCEQEIAAGLEEHQKPDNAVFNQCLQYLIDHDDSAYLTKVVRMLEGHIGRWKEMPGTVVDVEELKPFVSSWKTARMPTLMEKLDEGEIQVAPTFREGDSMLRNAKRSTVQVVHSKGTGSGVVLSARGTIATNHHVVEGHLGGCSVIHPDTGEKVQVDVLKTFPGWDIAILKPRVGEKLQAWQPMPVNRETPESGQFVWALGYPLGFGYTVNDGSLSSVNIYEELPLGLGTGEYDANSVWLKTSCPINSGNSGGPLVNADGELLGLNTWYPNQDYFDAHGGPKLNQIYFAVSAQHVISAWEAVLSNETSEAGLISLASVQVSAGSFSVLGKDLLMAYKSRVDAIGLQKEREKQEAEMRVKRAAEMAAKAEEEKRAKVWEKFDSFCEAARDGIKHSSLKATGDAITGAKSELDAIENEGLEGIERGETIIQFLRAELDRKKKAPAGKQSRWNSVINKYEAVVDRADCEDQEGVLLNAYAAFRICELRIHLQKTYIGQYRNSRLSTGMRNSANKKADDEAREGKVYLGLLRSKRFSSAKDENGRNLLSRANGL